MLETQSNLFMSKVDIRFFCTRVKNVLVSSDYKSVVDRDQFILERQAVDPTLSCVFFFCTHPILATAGFLVFSQVAWGTELGAGVCGTVPYSRL